jgi:hypothetical protein
MIEAVTSILLFTTEYLQQLYIAEEHAALTRGGFRRCMLIFFLVIIQADA